MTFLCWKRSDSVKWENLLYFNITDSCHHSEVPPANPPQPKDFGGQPWQLSGLEVIVEELELEASGLEVIVEES